MFIAFIAGLSEISFPATVAGLFSIGEYCCFLTNKIVYANIVFKEINFLFNVKLDCDFSPHANIHMTLLCSRC